MTTVDVAVQDKVTHQGWWLRSPVPAALAIGWLSGIAALALPWVGLELSPSLRAWSLPLSWPPLPQSSWLNYGDAILLLLVVSVISSARHGWARSPLTRLCGAALVVLTLAFVATSRLEVGSVMQQVS
ncbi:MAG TPA: hypothetical protein VEJ84_04260, partial [Acidimicrobiales bacterium]|nr:hypothetical protein [Acidimicrobiales bacterium]